MFIFGSRALILVLIQISFSIVYMDVRMCILLYYYVYYVDVSFAEISPSKYAFPDLPVPLLGMTLLFILVFRSLIFGHGTPDGQ